MGSYKLPAYPAAHPVIAQLVRARQDRNLSQSALGERLGISQTALSYWEAGKRDVGFSDLVRWAAALGLDVAAVEPVTPDGPLPELVAGGLA